MARTYKELESGKNEPCDCGSDSTVKPPWLDMERFKNGQEFFKRHILAMTLALHCSLVVGFSIISLLDALVFTGHTDTPKKALKRYLVTFKYLFTWHTEDVWDSPDGKAFKSVQEVRGKHNRVAKEMEKKNPDMKKPFVSQYDLAMVQGGFFSAFLLYHEGFGVRCTRQELEDYVHFWRGIGYLLGMDDKYNVCSGSFDDTKSLCNDLEHSILLPSLADPPKMFAPMADAYCDGTNLISHFAINTKEAIIAFVFDGMGIPKPKLGWKDWLRYLVYKWQVSMIYYVPGFEKLLNKGFMDFYNRFIKTMKSGSNEE